MKGMLENRGTFTDASVNVRSPPQDDSCNNVLKWPIVPLCVGNSGHLYLGEPDIGQIPSLSGIHKDEICKTSCTLGKSISTVGDHSDKKGTCTDAHC
jgi:hypothetical protein